MKKYWFTLYPNTFLWVKGNDGFIYNADNYGKLKFCNEGQIAELTNLLLDVNSLYCVELTENSLGDGSVNEWVHNIIDAECGSLIEITAMSQRPLSLPPVLKVQDDTEYYEWEHRQNIDGNIMQNLHSLIFFINGSEYGNDLYSKQTLYPVESELTLDSEKICRFAMNAKYSSYLSEIALVGNPFKVPGLAEMIAELKKICPVTLYATIQDLARELSQAKELSAIANINLLITDNLMSDSLAEITSWSDDISYTFIITSEQEYETAAQCSESLNLKNSNIIPVYNGVNLPFIEECLYLNEEDLQDIALSKREVFIRQSLNVFHFGKLYILPNGNIHSNLNESPLGTIDETPHGIVYHELTTGNSWLRIRNQLPCSNCIFQWLCPSPSNYESVIGKTNLCHVKP